MNTFEARAVDIFRPYRDEMPWQLLLQADPDEHRVRQYADPDWTRIAKFDGEVVGVYVVRANTPLEYQILNLAVAAPCRGKGLGSWLLGHAIGISESKGAREIVTTGFAQTSLFLRVGFEPAGEQARLTLMPE